MRPQGYPLFGRDPGRDAEFWSKKMAEAEVERRGYHRLAARGHMSAAERELETARARGAALRRSEHDRDALVESYAGVIGEALEGLSPEERHRVYKLLRLEARFRPGWPLEISGIFAQVAEERETGLSYRNRSPRSV